MSAYKRKLPQPETIIQELQNELKMVRNKVIQLQDELKMVRDEVILVKVCTTLLPAHTLACPLLNHPPSLSETEGQLQKSNGHRQ